MSEAKQGRVAAHVLWPGLVVGLLAFSVGSQLWLVAMSRSDGGARIEEDYYRRGLGWEQRQEARSRAQRLGWRVEVVGVREGASRLRLEIKDGAGVGVRGLEGEVELRRADEVSPLGRTPLREDAALPGVYWAEAPPWRAGLWDLTLQGRWRGEAVEVQLRQEQVAGGV